MTSGVRKSAAALAQSLDYRVSAATLSHNERWVLINQPFPPSPRRIPGKSWAGAYINRDEPGQTRRMTLREILGYDETGLGAVYEICERRPGLLRAYDHG